MKRSLLRIIYSYKYIARVFRETRFPLFIYTDCKYYPSCSDYAVEAINKHGTLKGSVKSLIRILKCSPFSRGGIDLP